MVDPISLTFAALGDSLTAGFDPYQPLGYGHPYTALLDNIVRMELSRRGMDRVEASFINLGVNGDTTRGMLNRFEAQIAPTEPDHVIIWGGINDLYGGTSPEEVMENLRQLYGKAEGIGATPIACTLTSVLGFDQVIPLIRRFNYMIDECCSEDEVSMVDLFAACSDWEGRLLEAFSSDGVHLNGEGNERVAATIYEEAVKTILEGLT